MAGRLGANGWLGRRCARTTNPAGSGLPRSAFDFAFAAVLLGGGGLVLELAARISGNSAYRAGFAMAVAAAVGLIWVNAAVGFLRDEDNPAKLMFAAVILTASIGAALAGFRPAGIARAMFAAAAAQLLVGAIGLATGLGRWASPASMKS